MDKRLFSLAAVAGVLFLFACSDDSYPNTKGPEGDNASTEDIREVESLKDLGRCTSEREGDTVYVIEKLRDYICINHAWIDASENLEVPSLKSSSSEAAPHSSSSKDEEKSSSSRAVVGLSSSVDVPKSSSSRTESRSSSSEFTQNSSSSEDVSNHRIVEDVYGVGECSVKNEGHTVFVKSNAVTYICEEGAWTVFVSVNSSSSINSSVSSSASLSVVPEYSEINDVMQLAKCDASSENNVVLVKKDTSYYTCSNGAWIKSEEHGFVVKKRSILGVAQKGPFKFGSPVYLRELAGDDLHFTGKVYKDEISSNKGDFVIPNVNLIYPYASVEVRGQYRNEITGEYSKDSISLFALTDLKTDSRSKVNVNLLTHLEYKRATYLVRKGYSVYAAKKQADQEIMTAFELPTTIKYSEDLSVFEDSEDDNVDYANASLMMLNLLFLGNRSDEEIDNAFEKFIKDFEKDGVWDDDSTKAVMADFATEVDGDEIRANVKAWNILDVPAFETQLQMFWNNAYGLGGCITVRVGVIVKNKNGRSKNADKFYKCSEFGNWIEATKIEYDTYGWEAGEVGEVKKGDITETMYVYRNGKWNYASGVESILGSCSGTNAGTVSTYNDVYYICKSYSWTEATVIEYDTYGWAVGEVGEVKKGNVTDAKYVYRNGKWNAANSVETVLGSCVAANDRTVVSNGNEYYVCEIAEWRRLDMLRADTYGWAAGEEGEVKQGNVTSYKYVYRDGKWREADALESALGSCVAANMNELKEFFGNYYICKDSRWSNATTIEYDTYGWAAGEVGEVKQGNVTSYMYVYRDGSWKRADPFESALGSCVAANVNEVKETGGNHYICKDSRWSNATTIEYDTYGWAAGEVGEVKQGNVTSYKYVYRDGKWNYASVVECELGGCIAANNRTVVMREYGNDYYAYYACENTEWKSISAIEFDTYDFVCSEDGALVDGRVNTANKYVCDDGAFRMALEEEVDLNLGCTSYTEGEVIRRDISASAGEIWTCSSTWNKEYGTLLDARDNQSYKIITIGTQTWMAENLNYDYNEGTAKSYVNSEHPEFGRYYTWAAAMDSAAVFSTNSEGCGNGVTCFVTTPARGVCPEGWHIPTNSEWNTLYSVMCKSPNASMWDDGNACKANAMQAVGYEEWSEATDEFGFSALPAGHYEESSFGSVGFSDVGSYTYFWSATEGAGYYTNYWYLGANFAELILGGTKHDGNSVRCLQDSREGE